MIIYIFFLLGSFVSTKCLAQDVAWIEGCVYEDGNQNGIQDKGEKGISGIAISNGLFYLQINRDISESDFLRETVSSRFFRIIGHYCLIK